MPGKKRETPCRVEALGKPHDKDGFRCGSGPLDHYLEVQAGQDTRMRVAATFVLCEGERNRVIGFYTLSAISVDIGARPENVAKTLPRYPAIPATLLGRLVSTRSFRGGVPESIF